MPTIHAPIPNLTARSNIGPLILDFKDGTATYDGELSDGVRAYLTSQGYGVDSDATPSDPAPAVTDLNGDPAGDSRDTPTVVEAAALRDAAVDPKPEDFLPPVNAGNADPQGTQVVAPGIHAADGKPIHPGPVGRSGGDGEDTVVKDTDAQQANETKLAADVLVDQVPVPAATATAAQVDPVNTDVPTGGPFDPADHSVAEVNDHLANADDAEKQRVLDAERAGKARKGVVGE